MTGNLSFNNDPELFIPAASNYNEDKALTQLHRRILSMALHLFENKPLFFDPLEPTATVKNEIIYLIEESRKGTPIKDLFFFYERTDDETYKWETNTVREVAELRETPLDTLQFLVKNNLKDVSKNLKENRFTPEAVAEIRKRIPEFNPKKKYVLESKENPVYTQIKEDLLHILNIIDTLPKDKADTLLERSIMQATENLEENLDTYSEMGKLITHTIRMLFKEMPHEWSEKIPQTVKKALYAAYKDLQQILEEIDYLSEQELDNRGDEGPSITLIEAANALRKAKKLFLMACEDISNANLTPAEKAGELQRLKENINALIESEYIRLWTTDFIHELEDAE